MSKNKWWPSLVRVVPGLFSVGIILLTGFLLLIDGWPADGSISVQSQLWLVVKAGTFGASLFVVHHYATTPTWASMPEFMHPRMLDKFWEIGSYVVLGAGSALALYILFRLGLLASFGTSTPDEISLFGTVGLSVLAGMFSLPTIKKLKSEYLRLTGQSDETPTDVEMDALTALVNAIHNRDEEGAVAAIRRFFPKPSAMPVDLPKAPVSAAPGSPPT